MPVLPPVRLTGATLLQGGELAEGALTLSDGLITEGPAPEVDLSGFLLLPGIIDLHGDGFERHLTPRPAAPFDKPRALRSVAAEMAANGITTAWMAQSWSWEGGFRSGEAAEALLDALEAARPGLLADLRVQIRLETHVPDEHPRLIEAIRRHRIDFVIYNNHLPEALEMLRDRPLRFAQWAAQQGRSAEELQAIVEAAAALEPSVAPALAALAPELARQGVVTGSHDDPDAATRAFYRGLGARVSEFPTTLAAARAAVGASDPVLMGAPNVVRGASQSGNVAAQELVEAGLVTALMSDYYYPALAQSAFALQGRGVMGLAQAWDLVSGGPARVMGLADRGALAPGLRADLVVVDPVRHTVEATLAGGRLAYAHGEAARRLVRLG